MEEHFNENYIESAKYPISTFKGKINEKLPIQNRFISPKYITWKCKNNFIGAIRRNKR